MNKTVVTLEQLEQYAKIYPEMKILDFIKILNRTSEYKKDKRGCYYGK